MSKLKIFCDIADVSTIKKYSKKNYKNISILWVSTREAYNYIQAKQLGCDIITMPPKIINVIENFGLSLDQLTKSTIVNFIKDSKKSKFKIIFN